MASRTRRPACKMIRKYAMPSFDPGRIHCTGITSRPMPSPGMRPMRNDLEAIPRSTDNSTRVNAERLSCFGACGGIAEIKLQSRFKYYSHSQK